MSPEAPGAAAPLPNRAAADGLPIPQRYWSVLTIWIGLVMAVLDSAIANVALPTIARDLAAEPAESVWVVSAYQLTIVVSLLPLAALGGAITYRRVYLSGVVAFTIASLGCSLVHSLPALALMRALQGFGAAGVMSVNGALLRFTYPAARLGRGVGFNALVVSISAAVGPSVASAILAVGPWQWLFAVNVPFGILAFLLGRAALPVSPTAGRLDKRGTLLNMATFGLLFTGVDVLTRGGVAWVGAVEIAAALGVGVLLVQWSRKQPHPLVPIDLLKSRIFTLSVATSIASFTAQMLAFVSMPFFLQGVMHRDQVETGLLMTPWPCAVGVSATLAGRLSDRYPAAILSSAGLALLCIGLASLALLPADAGSQDVIWRMALCGFGFGFFQAPNNRTLLASAPIHRSGAAGGMLATARLIGQTTGATVTAICFRVVADAEGVALAIAAVSAGLAAVASLSRLTAKPRRSA
ncbi:multidrug MFS transporter [Aliidongia dinghuensis]|uniref:Multidrug MFS transporter n=1 Tax=Aliidongia dinghuensis TaxID=1867774 RepID=A0A8J2YTM2_9PROT|nr:MFS transporter [Aliidongia dinghuensis]GGF20129.1 multidrug MFS transporter [Aliidongia dinghuensis]